MEKKKEFVRYSSGNDEEFTIFDALLESMIKQKEKKSSIHRLLNSIKSPKKFVDLNLDARGKLRRLGNKKNYFKSTLCDNQEFTIYDLLSKSMIKHKGKKS